MGGCWIKPYIADIDDLASVGASGSKVSEGVGRDGAGRGLETGAGRRTSTEASTASKASTKSSASSSEATSATESLAKSSAHTAAAKATSATEAHARAAAGVAILADLDHATLPVIAVKLLDSGASIIGALKDDDT